MQCGINPRTHLHNLPTKTKTTIDDFPQVSRDITLMEYAYEMDNRIVKWFINEINYTHHIIGTHARLVPYSNRLCSSERAFNFKPHQTDRALGENITR
jgi:hypothetical protein